MTNGKIVNLNSVRDNRKPRPLSNTLEGFSFSNEVDKEINNLMKATGLDRPEAVSLAKDFYRTYPMLIEFVRSPNELLKK